MYLVFYLRRGLATAGCFTRETLMYILINWPVTGGGWLVCTCLDIRFVNFFLPLRDLYFTVRDGRPSESAAKLP